jgi:threonyl-tRNA synthetase
VLDLLRDFGLNDFYLELSTRPEGKAVGSDEEWDEADRDVATSPGRPVSSW